MIRYHARWVLPVTTAPVENATVCCDDGKITYVGPRSAAPPGTDHDTDHDLGDALLMPGLINAHTHLELTAMRGFLEELAFPDWIDTLRRARGAALDDDMLLDSARLGIAEGLEHGVTTFADTSASGVTMRAMLDMGVRGIMYQEVFGPDPESCDAALAELDRRVTTLRAAETALVRVGVSPHAPYTVSDQLYRVVAAYAAQHSLPMAMHIAESADERELVCAGTGTFAESLRARGIAVAQRARSPIALLSQSGSLELGPLLIHCVTLDGEDIRTIVRKGAAVVHCPASNARFGHGIAPVAELLDAGAVVALGSDSVASNNQMDVLAEARLAALMQGARGRGASAIAASRALYLATKGGARALGLAHVVGSLEVGSSADLAVFRLDDCRATPVHDAAATAIFSLAGARADLVTVAGVELVRDGQLVGDGKALRARACRAAAALHQWRSHAIS